MGDIGGSQERDQRRSQRPGRALGDVARDRAEARRRVSPYSGGPYYENKRKHDSPYHEPDPQPRPVPEEDLGPRHLASRRKWRIFRRRKGY